MKKLQLSLVRPADTKVRIPVPLARAHTQDEVAARFAALIAGGSPAGDAAFREKVDRLIDATLRENPEIQLSPDQREAVHMVRCVVHFFLCCVSAVLCRMPLVMVLPVVLMGYVVFLRRVKGVAAPIAVITGGPGTGKTATLKARTCVSHLTDTVDMTRRRRLRLSSVPAIGRLLTLYLTRAHRSSLRF